MNTIINFLKKYYKTIGYVILGVLFVYLLILICTPKPEIPQDLKNKIDSLTKVNSVLQEKQKSIDSTISKYQEKVNEVDFQIDNIKEKTTIIREYYHEISKEVGTYNNQQIDSFFKKRYNY